MLADELRGLVPLLDPRDDLAHLAAAEVDLENEKLVRVRMVGAFENLPHLELDLQEVLDGDGARRGGQSGSWSWSGCGGGLVPRRGAGGGLRGSDHDRLLHFGKGLRKVFKDIGKI